MSKFLQGVTFKKEYKKRNVRVNFVPRIYQDECSVVNTPHLHQCAIMIAISTDKEYYYYNYTTLADLIYDCTEINEAMKYFNSLQKSRKLFVSVLESLLMENSL